MRILSAATLLLLAACGPTPAPTNNQAEAPPAAPGAAQPTADVAAAERLVLARLGNPEGVTFSTARTIASEGANIVCGELTLGGRRQRYIVAGEQAFVESRMRAGEMDRAMREFCGEGERG